MPRSVEQLKSELLQRELLADLDLQSVDSDAVTVDGYAQTLVSRGLLTEFQVECLLAGNGHTLTLDRYVLLDRIGAGGMGQVYRARHRRMNRIVAVKILPPKLTLNPEAIARFQREARAVARLSHANIVRAHDASEAGGVHYLVMEYVPGQDLSSYVKQHGLLPIDQALDCVIQAARGLEYAHQQGVMHRDIKPANLLLSDEGVVKVLDLGLARFEQQGDASLTRTGMVMGTFDYMSPEQALDTRSADARSDIYSLGCSLHYFLTGKPVFAADTAMKKLLAHREDSVPNLQEHCPQASQALDAVFQRMLAKDPAARFPSMQSVITVLEQCRGGVVDASELHMPPIASSSESAIVDSKAETERVGAEVMDSRAHTTSPMPKQWLVISLVAVCSVVVLLGVGGWALWGGKDNGNTERVQSNDNSAVVDLITAAARPSEPSPPPIELPTVTSRPPVASILTGIFPGEADELLPGLLATPAKLPGIRRWQLNRVNATGSNSSIDWSPDGRYIATGCDDGVIRVFDTAKQEICALLPGRGDSIKDVSWHPDSKHLAAVGVAWCTIWNQQSSSEFRLEHTSKNDTMEGLHVGWSPDGKWLATWGGNNWAHSQGLIIRDSSLTIQSSLSLPAVLIDLSWAPDSKRLAVTDPRGGLHIISRDGKELANGNQDNQTEFAVAWHPKLDLIATPTSGGVIFWDSAGKRLKQFSVPKETSTSPWRVARWSPDGSQLAIGVGAGYDVYIVSEQGEVTRRLESVATHLSDVSWSNSNRSLVATGGYAHTSMIHLGNDNRSTIFPSMQPLTSSQSWRPDGDLLSVSGMDGDVYHWNTVSASVETIEAGDSLCVVEWSPDGQRFACGRYSPNIVEIFNREHQKIAGVGGLGALRDLSWSSNSARLAVYSSDHAQLSILDRNGEIMEKHSLDQVGTPAIRWHPSEPVFAMGVNNAVEIRDETGHLQVSWPTESWSGISTISWADGGKSLVTGFSGDGAINWTRDGRGQFLIPRGIFEGFPCVSVNRKDGRIATFCPSYLWDAKYARAKLWSSTGQFLGAQPTTRGGGQRSVAWSPNGSLLSILGADGAAQLWSGNPLRHTQTLLVNTNSDSFVINHDGTKLLSGDVSRFDETFRCVIETEDGIQKTIRYTELAKLIPDENQPVASQQQLAIPAPPLSGLLTNPSNRDSESKWQLAARENASRPMRLEWNSRDQIAMSTYGGEVRLLDAKTLSLQQILPTYSGTITAAAWSPDGTSVVMGSDSGP